VPDSYEVKWFEMLKAEHLVTKRVSGREVASWEKVKPSARNEAIDCRVYSLAAFLSLRVDMKSRVAELKAKAVQQTEKVVNRAPAKRPGGFVTGWKQ
jgi:phage terminase large subunit GpA-like protein